jgi:DNA-binding IclR family transcriptional regulator
MAQKTIQSLAKGIDILFSFTEDTPLLTIDEISCNVGMPKSTCYRFLNTLKIKKMVDFDPSSGKYRIGARILKLESIAHRSLDIARIAFPFLKKLCEVSGETSQLVILNDEEGVCVEKVDSPHALRVMPNKGMAIGLHSGASGKAIMAHLSREEQDRIIKEKGLPRVTPKTITDPVLLRQRLQEIKKQGYAISEGEIYTGVKAVAAPIFDHRRKVTGSICVAGPIERLTQEKTNPLIVHVLDSAKGISKVLQGNVND